MMNAGRRDAISLIGLGAAVGTLSLARVADAAPVAGLLPPGAAALGELTRRLADKPRRRAFKTVPMILTEKDQWDHEAVAEVLAYKPAHKQAWDMVDIAGPWLNLIRNALNAQIWSYGHPDFLVVAACHSTAQVALYDQAMWDKYQLSKLVGGKVASNTLIAETLAQDGDTAKIQDAHGPFSAADNSIPALMKRGVVFMACHNAIWEQAGTLIENGVNPDKLGQEALTAELTNHLVPDVVLTPGAVATLPELQGAGFHYIK